MQIMTYVTSVLTSDRCQDEEDKAAKSGALSPAFCPYLLPVLTRISAIQALWDFDDRLTLKDWRVVAVRTKVFLPVHWPALLT